MNDENYINIQGWMINRLELKGNELLLYAIIYGFSQDGKNDYYGSLRYISKALKISRPTVINTINKLIEKELIIRTKESHYKTGVVKKLYQGGKETLPLGGKESLPNNNNTNNNINTQIKNLDSVNPLSEIKETHAPPETYEPVENKILTAPQTKWKNIKRVKKGLEPTFKKKSDKEKIIERFMERYRLEMSTEPVRKAITIEMRQIGNLLKTLTQHELKLEEYIDWWFERKAGAIGYGFQQFTAIEFVGQFKEGKQSEKTELQKLKDKLINK